MSRIIPETMLYSTELAGKPAGRVGALVRWHPAHMLRMAGGREQRARCPLALLL